MDADNPQSEALLIGQDKISRVGKLASFSSILEQGVKTVDMAGQTILPDFIDSHQQSLAYITRLHSTNLLYDANRSL